MSEEKEEEEKKKKEAKEKEEQEKKKKEEIREKIRKGYLRCHLVFEVIGNPADFIEKALEGVIENLGKEKGLSMISSNLQKARQYQNQENLFSAFAELEILIESFKRFIELIFDFMPSSVEIFEPEEFKVKISDCNSFLNDLAVRLHQYDITLRKVMLERGVLFKKLKELQGQGKKEDKGEKEK
jgi:hypothetical protein